MLAEAVLQEIKNTGYGFITLGKDALIGRAIKGFHDFLDESDEYRMGWNFVCEHDPKWQIGFLPRKEPINVMTGHPYDFKDVFHYQPALVSRLHRAGVDMKTHDEWLTILQELYVSVSTEVNPLIEALQSRYSSEREHLQAYHGFRGGHTLRLLRYHMNPRKEGVIGLGHVDESVVTVKVFQNIPGIRVGSPDDVRLAQIPSGRNIIYPGRKAEYISNGDIVPLWHDVIDSRESDQDTTKRTSIIFFADAIEQRGDSAR